MVCQNLVMLTYFVLLLLGQPLEVVKASENQGNESIKHIHGSHEECSLPRNSQDIVDCAMIMHPQVQRMNFKWRSSRKLMGKASQSPNKL